MIETVPKGLRRVETKYGLVGTLDKDVCVRIAHQQLIGFNRDLSSVGATGSAQVSSRPPGMRFRPSSPEQSNILSIPGRESPNKEKDAVMRISHLPHYKNLERI